MKLGLFEEALGSVFSISDEVGQNVNSPYISSIILNPIKGAVKSICFSQNGPINNES